MKNFIQQAAILGLIAPAAVSSGEGVLVGTIFGVAQTDAVSGADVDLVRTGAFTLPKVSAQVWALGVKVFWDDTAKKVTTTASGNTLIGAAIASAANPSDTGDVLLDGAVR